MSITLYGCHQSIWKHCEMFIIFVHDIERRTHTYYTSNKRGNPHRFRLYGDFMVVLVSDTIFVKNFNFVDRASSSDPVSFLQCAACNAQFS